MSVTLYIFNEPKWPEAAAEADSCISSTKKFRAVQHFSSEGFLSLMNWTPDRRSVSLRLLCTQTASHSSLTPASFHRNSLIKSQCWFECVPACLLKWMCLCGCEEKEELQAKHVYLLHFVEIQKRRSKREVQEDVCIYHSKFVIAWKVPCGCNPSLPSLIFNDSLNMNIETRKRKKRDWQRGKERKGKGEVSWEADIGRRKFIHLCLIYSSRI